MPRATVDINDTKRIDLKTLPGEGDEQGYVVLRRLSYGQKVQRQQMSMEISMQQAERGSENQMQLKMQQERLAVFDFANCVVDHNLEDHSGRKLNFKAPHDVFLLDPRVGEEIAVEMDKMNNYEEALGNSETGFERQSSPNGNPNPMSNTSSI